MKLQQIQVCLPAVLGLLSGCAPSPNSLAASASAQWRQASLLAVRNPCGVVRSKRSAAVSLKLLLATFVVALALALVMVSSLRKPAASSVESLVAGHPTPDATPITSRPFPGASENLAASETKPLSAKQISGLLRQRPSLPEVEWVRRLQDQTQPLKVRRQAAFALARLDSSSAMAALKESFAREGPQLRAAIAEALGASPLAEARTWLAQLTKDASESTARGAVRGWATAGNAEAARVLIQLLEGTDTPDSVRSEAALALGELHAQPTAYQSLTNTAWRLDDPELAAVVLEGLGKRPLPETELFFRDYLGNLAVPSELRVKAVEALANASGDPQSLLVQYLADADPEVRAGAAWAMSATESAGQAGHQLVARLAAETEPEVRLRLYQALGNQEAFDASAVIPLIQREQQLPVIVSGLDLLAQACQQNPSPILLRYFEETAVSQLRDYALRSNDHSSRMASVIALQRARTPKAQAALAEIGQQATDVKVAEAAGRASR